MNHHYQIEPMTRDEMDLAIDWARKEGWNPGLHDADCFYRADPHGFFAGKLNGKIIAVGSAVIYDSHFAFCGFYMVDKACRGQGYGLALTRARLAYVGERNIGIDGVLNMVSKYERIGYQFAHYNARYSLTQYQTVAVENPNIVDLKSLPLTQLFAFDRRHFPAPRADFLSAWIKQPDSLALGYVVQDQLRGYGVIRKCVEGFKIGPLFAEDMEIAEQLLDQLLPHAQGQLVSLDIPENNSYAVKLVKRYGMQKVFATARMYMKEAPDLASQQIYGITTFELG